MKANKVMQTKPEQMSLAIMLSQQLMDITVAWPSGLRRWFKAPVSSEAWVRIPPLPEVFYTVKDI